MVTLISMSPTLCPQILRAIFASRNGLSESELFEILPGLTWNFWAPVSIALLDQHILMFRSGLLVFAHEQVIEHAILQPILIFITLIPLVLKKGIPYPHYIKPLS